MNHLVIMAGGVGSRFWPLSSEAVPKQFLDVLGCGKTLIQLTVDRFKNFVPMENIWIVKPLSQNSCPKCQQPMCSSNRAAAIQLRVFAMCPTKSRSAIRVPIS